MKVVHLIVALCGISLFSAAVRAGSDLPCDFLSGPNFVLTYQYDPGTSRDTAPAVPGLVSNPTAYVTQYTYDPPTQLITPPSGQHIGGFTYDGANNVITTTVPAVQTGGYDFQDRQTSMTDSTTTHSGGNTMTAYDHQGNLTQSITPPGSSTPVTTQYQYDTNGNRTVYDALDSHNIPTHYDNNSSTGSSSMIDQHGITTQYTYQANNDAMTQTVTDAMGHLTTSTYDALDRQVGMTNPSGSMTYDTNQTNTNSHYDMTNAPGNVTRNTYDALDRTTTVTDAHSNVTTYQYDAMDRQTRMTDAGSLGNTTTIYDTQNRTSSMTDPLGHTTSYTYDSMYNMTSTPEAGGGRVTQSTYDATGSMTDPLGRVTTYDYNATYDLTRLPGPDGFTYQYTYDVTDTITPPNLPAVQYTYDISDDLIPQSGFPPFAPQYTYDAAYDFTGPQGLSQNGSIAAALAVTFVPLPAALPAGLALMFILAASRRLQNKKAGG